MVRDADTGFLVLFIVEGYEFWLAIDYGAYIRYIGAHTIVSDHGNEYCKWILI